MKRWWLAFVVVLSALLAGCATPKIQSDVTVFQEWSADLQGQTFVFERTKEQDNNLEYRTYENLVRNELHRLGFVDANTTQSPKLKVTMSYHISARDVRVVQPVVVDPFWYGSPFYGPRWRHHYYSPFYGPFYGPFYDPFWYTPPVTEYRETNYEVFRRRLRVTLSRAADSKKLYEVTVDSEGRNGSLAAVMPYMVRSAFTDFPGKSGVSRRIEMEMKD